VGYLGKISQKISRVLAAMRHVKVKTDDFACSGFLEVGAGEEADAA